MSHHEIAFSGVSAAAQFVASTPRREGAANHSEEERSDSFDGGVTMPECLSITGAGGYWPEGAELLYTAAVSVAGTLSDMFTPEPAMGIAGGALSVPVFLSGDPECFEAVSYTHLRAHET